MTEATRAQRNPIATRLLASSTLFVRSAVDAYASESWETFYLHLGTAVELLIKAVLADAHPSFIADPKADFDSLLHLSGLATKPAGVRLLRLFGPSPSPRRWRASLVSLMTSRSPGPASV